MSATASTGSPTLRRSVASRSVSQENVGPSEDLAARLVSSTSQNPALLRFAFHLFRVNFVVACWALALPSFHFPDNGPTLQTQHSFPPREFLPNNEIPKIYF